MDRSLFTIFPSFSSVNEGIGRNTKEKIETRSSPRHSQMQRIASGMSVYNERMNLMNRYPPKPPLYDADNDAIFDETFNVASSTECTGLIPSAPLSGSEADSYSEIYDVPLTKTPADAVHALQNVKKESDTEKKP